MEFNKNKNMKILIAGSGYMAREYLLVLSYLKFDCIVVGRGKKKIEQLRREFPQFSYHSGGIQSYLDKKNEVTNFAINTVNINQLELTSFNLIIAGVKNLLVEKPAGLTLKGLQNIEIIAKENEARVLIAYNRRFFSSICELKKQINVDGGVSSLHFEFTEWIDSIDRTMYDSGSLNKWILSNSSHVIDTVFDIIGLPSILNPIVIGENKIKWHKSGSIFIGSGISVNNVPFTYHSNWEAPGRWSIEILTKNRRFYLRPMEKLQVQHKGSLLIESIAIDDQLDNLFKPGLYNQIQTFLNGKFGDLLSLENHIKAIIFYNKIGGYKN